MDHKENVDLIHELLDSLPKKYQDKDQQMAYQHGYLIGLLAHLAGDDFYAKGKIDRRIKALRHRKK